MTNFQFDSHVCTITNKYTDEKTRFWIVSNLEDANFLFIRGCEFMLCVNIPQCRICTDCAQAVKFFNESGAEAEISAIV
jgi:hypothetical protein